MKLFWIMGLLGLWLLITGCSYVPLQHQNHVLLGTIWQEPHTYDLAVCWREVTHEGPPAVYGDQYACEAVHDELILKRRQSQN